MSVQLRWDEWRREGREDARLSIDPEKSYAEIVHGVVQARYTEWMAKRLERRRADEAADRLSRAAEAERERTRPRPPRSPNPWVLTEEQKRILISIGAPPGR